ncbi:MAG: hypothetical protein SVO01_13245 [Thermotogota bacterium]|nr:hypothetical protein [Thermotogota bacterium]
MKISYSILTFSLAMFLILSSCNEQIVKTPVDDIPDYVGLDTVATENSFQLDVPLRSTVPGFCYLAWIIHQPN